MADRRTIASFIIGAVLCGIIWLAVPYNNFVLNNSFIADSYLPEIVALLLAGLILLVNPLLYTWAPRAALRSQDLVLICTMMLFAAVLPGNGLMRFMPHSLVQAVEQINESPVIGPAIAESDLPPELFPDPIGYDKRAPASEQMLDELEPGTSIPWAAWTGPIIAWGSLIIVFWVLMIGMGMMVYPQWRHIERLSFPLLRVYHAFLAEPKGDHRVPDVFRSGWFWSGCGVVFFLHSTQGLATFTEGDFPAFPLAWNISPMLTEGIWQYTPGFLKSTRLYFIFIGLAYFMPSRYSFSIWFTVLAVGLFNMQAQMYMPGFDTGQYYDLGSGAVLAMVGGIIWLGRSHYLQVMRAAIGLGGHHDAAGLVDRSQVFAGRLFIGGTIAMFGWFLW
ncbi:MAG: DUF6785 family protein, partial [Phycisphaeraceae bacterium]|nr:DUF6785 family protein [Phycisphaeraceae bacterium]